MPAIAEKMKKSGAFEKVGADYLIYCFGATYTNAYIEREVPQFVKQFLTIK